MSKETFDKFSEDVSNIDIPEEDLIHYFKEQEQTDKLDGFAPNIVIDENEVDLQDVEDSRVEGAVVFRAVNGLSRNRRKKKFIRSIKKHRDRPIIVTEGDSWFQFPFLLKDVVDNLSDHFSVYSVGAAGARASEMIFEKPEYLQALMKAKEISGRSADAFVFSSGGNDILGKEGDIWMLEQIVRKHQAGETVSLATAYQEENLRKKLEFLRIGYEKVIADIRAINPTLPLFFHSYDSVWPYNNENDQDERKGRWIQPPLNEQGVTKFVDQRLITSDLIGRFKNILQETAKSHSNVFYVDTGQPLADHLDLWHDEIHPNNKGYKIVSKHFVDEINKRLFELA